MDYIFFKMKYTPNIQILNNSHFNRYSYKSLVVVYMQVSLLLNNENKRIPILLEWMKPNEFYFSP